LFTCAADKDINCIKQFYQNEKTGKILADGVWVDNENLYSDIFSIENPMSLYNIGKNRIKFVFEHQSRSENVHQIIVIKKEKYDAFVTDKENFLRSESYSSYIVCDFSLQNRQLKVSDDICGYDDE
jgi:hypothetical protein